MHEEDERPTNEKSHAYHFSITNNGCDFCLLIPPAILALPKCTLFVVHLPEILFSSLQLKLFDIAQRLDWLQSLKQFIINVSYHILVASLTLMALF